MEQRDAMVEQDLAVYGKADMRDLALSVQFLIEELKPHLTAQPSLAEQAASDLVPRGTAWTPVCWQHLSIDRSPVELPAHCLQQPSWNIFAGAVMDEPVNIAIPEFELMTKLVMEGAIAGNLQLPMPLPYSNLHPRPVGTLYESATAPTTGESSTLSHTPSISAHSEVRYTPSVATTGSVADEWQGSRVVIIVDNHADTLSRSVYQSPEEVFEEST
ncbi:hypothetical protein FS749_010640 [Ceratobasidium sp. UAMH 11750]|nr:hypothetical protein FS749_010640 [Ceratobasidium sp. UAMH 11750]